MAGFRGDVYYKLLNHLALQKTGNMTRIKDIRLILSFFFITGLAACGTNQNDMQAGVQLPATSKLDTAATRGFTALLHNYYNLKDALVQANSADADKAANAMQARIRYIRTTADTAWTKNDSLQQQLDTMAFNLDKILAVKDASCEIQRVYFKPVSDALYAALKLIQLQHVTVYHTFCPMAFREKGAFWLSADATISNPYFGAKMIECGEVIDTLK